MRAAKCDKFGMCPEAVGDRRRYGDLAAVILEVVAVLVVRLPPLSRRATGQSAVSDSGLEPDSVLTSQCARDEDAKQ